MDSIGLERIAEVAETVEQVDVNELLGQRETLQEQLSAALENGNTEKVNYFRGAISEIDYRLELEKVPEGAAKSSEILFGGRHSSEHWHKMAGEELAKNGKTPRYRELIQRAGAAEAQAATRK